jgi:hypothetical protein
VRSAIGPAKGAALVADAEMSAALAEMNRLAKIARFVMANLPTHASPAERTK